MPTLKKNMSRRFGLTNRLFNDFVQPSFTRSRWALPDSNRLVPFAGDSLVPNNYFDNFFEPLVFRENYFNNHNDLNMNEEPDKYVISFKDENINDKDVKVDFHKKQNELRIEISEKSKKEEDGSTQEFSSSYQSSVRFDKEVKPDDISAEVKDGNVSIVIPKVENDADNIVSVKVTGSDVRNLIDSKPEEK